jgi:nitrate/nitrite transporter NarK
MLFLAMVVYGMGLPLGTVAMTVWAGDLSTPEQYDDTIRRFQVGYAAGGLIFSSLPGILADRFGGSYVPAYLFFTLCAVFTLLAVQRIYRIQGQAK